MKIESFKREKLDNYDKITYFAPDPVIQNLIAELLNHKVPSELIYSLLEFITSYHARIKMQITNRALDFIPRDEKRTEALLGLDLFQDEGSKDLLMTFNLAGWNIELKDPE